MKHVQQTTRYRPCPVTDEGEALIEQMRCAAEDLALLFDRVSSREASIALTHLETAVLFGVKAASNQHRDDDSPDTA